MMGLSLSGYLSYLVVSQVAEMHAEYERQLQYEAEEAAHIQVITCADILLCLSPRKYEREK